MVIRGRVVLRGQNKGIIEVQVCDNAQDDISKETALLFIALRETIVEFYENTPITMETSWSGR